MLIIILNRNRKLRQTAINSIQIRLSLLFPRSPSSRQSIDNIHGAMLSIELVLAFSLGFIWTPLPLNGLNGSPDACSTGVLLRKARLGNDVCLEYEVPISKFQRCRGCLP